MSKDDNEKFEDKSDIPPISLPIGGFQSKLPPYLLEGKSESERFLLTELSKVGSFVEFCGPMLVSLNLEQRKTNGKVKTMWAYKEMFVNWKGLFIIIATLTAFVGSLIQFLPFVKAFFSAE